MGCVWKVAVRMIAVRSKGCCPAAHQSLWIKSLGVMSVMAGILLLQHFGMLAPPRMLASLREGHHVWLPLTILCMMVFLFTFALPAAPLIVMCGVFYPPIPATALVVLGGVSGSLSAYGFSRHFSMQAFDRRSPPSALVKRMRVGISFSSLFALRICPGVPHGAINYSAGALQAPLRCFLASTLAGFLAKGFVYTTAAHRATHIPTDANLWSFHVLWPLFALLLLAVAGISLERHLNQRRGIRTGIADANALP